MRISFTVFFVENNVHGTNSDTDDTRKNSS